MTELDHALSQLAFIQDRFTASTRFHGLAPHAVAVTGGLAMALAGAQMAWPLRFGATGVPFVWAWVGAAAVSTALIAVEALDRSWRLHGSLAEKMMVSTLRLLGPFCAVGGVMTVVIAQIAPGAIWVLPGVWQLLIALIGFTTVGTLPPTIIWPAAWYFLCGTITLLLAGQAEAPSPWMMGLPFGIGQLLVALILHRAGKRDGRG